MLVGRSTNPVRHGGTESAKRRSRWLESLFEKYVEVFLKRKKVTRHSLWIESGFMRRPLRHRKGDACLVTRAGQILAEPKFEIGAHKEQKNAQPPQGLRGHLLNRQHFHRIALAYLRAGGKSVQLPCATSAAMPMLSPSVGCG